MVRAWSAMARETPWRIHQVVYVREFVAAAPLELFRSPHQADVAFLNQVEELQAAVGVFFCDGNDETEVGFDEFLLGLLGFRFAAKNHLESPLQFGGPDFAGDFDFAEFLAAGEEIFARFGLDVGLRGFDAALKLDDFAFEEVNALDGLADFVDQTLFLERIEVEFAKAAGHLDAGAAQRIAGAQIRTLLRARDFVELLSLLHRYEVELGDFVDLLQRLFRFCFDLFFGELFVVELDDFFDRARPGAEIFADLQELFQNQRSACDGFQDEELPALDALGDGNFTFARQQWNCAHFADVCANRIVRLFESSGRQVQFAIIRPRFFFCFNRFRRTGCRKRSLCGREVFIDVNPIALKR